MATKLSIEQLKAQLEAAQKAFEEAQKETRDSVLPDLKKQVQLYGFTAEELGIEPPKAEKKQSLTGDIPQGTTLVYGPEKWVKAAGRGAPPKWLREYIRNGGDWKELAK